MAGMAGMAGAAAATAAERTLYFSPPRSLRPAAHPAALVLVGRLPAAATGHHCSFLGLGSTRSVAQAATRI